MINIFPFVITSEFPSSNYDDSGYVPPSYIVSNAPS